MNWRVWNVVERRLSPRISLPLLALVCLTLLLRGTALVSAQTQATSYWRFSASGRLHHVLSSDINEDGVAEFLVVDEDGGVSLLNSNGELQWSYNAEAPVLAVGAVDVDAETAVGQAIVLGMPNQLVMLNVDGEVKWESKIESFPTPLSLLTSGGESSEDVWLSQYEARPAAIVPFDDNDGRQQILVVLESGQLHLYDAKGQIIWRYTRNSKPTVDTQPHLAIGDLDGNSQQEIALGIFDPERRFSRLALIDAQGQAIWEQDQSISGRVTALTLVTFPQLANPYVAVGNNLGQVNLYNSERQRQWQRTFNKSITSLTAANLAEGPGLLVGTAVGSVTALDGAGRRSWTRYLAPEADHSIVALTAAPFVPAENQPTVSAIVKANDNELASADVILLDKEGHTTDAFPAVDTTGLTRLTDINQDQNSELLMARFAQVELIGLGLGASETAKGWDYNLFSEPRSVLVVDLDQDGTDEFLIGTQDGRIHSLDNNKSIRWLHAPGGAITHLAALSGSPDQAPSIVVVRNDNVPGLGNSVVYESWLEVRQANGKQVWEQQLPTQISTLAVGEVNGRGRSEIVIGTSDGTVHVISANGEQLWESRIGASVEHLLILPGSESLPPILIAASANQIFELADNSAPERLVAYPQGIIDIIHTNQPGSELAQSFLVLVKDGSLRSLLATRGRQRARWVMDLGGYPTASLVAKEVNVDSFEASGVESLLIAIDNARLLHLDMSDDWPLISWQLLELAETTSLYWNDLDGDALPEMAVGNRGGQVALYEIQSSGEPEQLANLDLASSVSALNALHSEVRQKSDLLAVTENGLVQLFRAQENWPPLLTSPRADLNQNQFSIVVSVHDIENDNVLVRLDIQDATTQAWIAQEEKQLGNSRGTLFWLIDDPPAASNGLRYRFHYDDGFHQGYFTPPIGPALSPLPAAATLSPASISLLTVVGLAVVVLLVRQSRLPSARARRFYRQLKQNPAEGLALVEEKYAYTNGSPDFLLHLANQARQDGDFAIASIADGLFLLADQPHAGLPIIINVLEQSSGLEPAWQHFERWQMTHKMAQSLLDAPTITALTLLRPQLLQLLNALDETGHWSPILDSLLPILTNLRDSERVEMAADRLVYLNEALVLLNQLRDHLPEFSVRIEKMLVSAIGQRWSGMVTAEIEDLRGRAELEITLKTKRLAPTPQTDIVLEICNIGQATAENVLAELDEDPAYVVHSPPQSIRFLPPGRKRQISFTIEPKVRDRFRIALTTIYDDRNRRDKVAAFGDMVHLLPPEREFKPIANPYLPGTPLRSNSAVFYGREELFSFIAENTGDMTQRNVLILVGERRTGKTSVLLRLGQHLPEHLVPVYVDCQSLGVIPGMPALLHDLSWYISDALMTRGIEIDVPEPAEWQENPTGCFQRRFLPYVKSLLPAGTTLVLVFDEFEAFENLVDDGILPSTLFPYLRHLMQHIEGLSFVFVGTRRLEEMSADYWSVLFNIALYQKIGYLSDEIATQLICEPVKPNLVYDDLALDKILRVTTGHPYFLQLVCYTLVKRANAQRSTYATISDVNAALDEMLRLGEVHFAYLWQRSTTTERALLTTMAHLIDRDTPFHPADLIRFLKPYGINLSPAELTTALDGLVERDILREMREETTTLYELKIGLVALWVARYKSLSTLLIGNGEQRATALRKV